MEEKRAENEKKDSTSEDLLLSIHGAKIKFNAHLGEFKVLNDVPTTQGKLTGTIVEKQIPNFTFYDGFQMISLTEWQDFGTAKVQENYVLLKKSTLPGTGKMPGNIPPETGKIEFVTSGQINEPESIDTKGAPVPQNINVLKKFMVNFRRPSAYKGEFGFDWMRDEYIYPITSVSGTNKELSLDIAKLKTEYKTTDVTNAVSPYGKDYYCSFLNIMMNQEVELDIEVEELESLSADATEVIFESSNPKLIITPTSIPLNTLIAGGKQTKSIGGTAVRDYYLATNQIKVKCDGQAFIRNEQIKIFAKLKDPASGIEDKKEVGKMMVMKNSEQLQYTINVYVIKAFMSDNPLFGESVIDAEFAKIGGLAGLEKYLNENSLNQGLIQVKLIDRKDTNPLKIELSTNTFNLANTGKNTRTGIADNDYENMRGIITNPNPSAFEVDSGKSVNLFNKQMNLLYNFSREKCILLYLCPLKTKDAGGSAYTIPLNNKHCIIFGTNLAHPQSYAHEIAHTLGLEHIFLSRDSSCNIISLSDEKLKIDGELTAFRTEIDRAKADIDRQWNAYRTTNSSFFNANPSRVNEYKAPYDQAKNKLEQQYNEYARQKRDEKNLIDKNHIKFLRSHTENIMDYWGDDANCDGTIETGITDKKSLNKFQWKIIQNEAKTYYH
ncbi:hypothetical protein [Chryseobacterium luteum]|uniref:hypothetical protein n=1 Tax=Chryseobacterium luteum TaxID=421531 RepID=UPI0013F4618E|nr:hypothetical protein [Chryseobacterium luteum]